MITWDILATDCWYVPNLTYVVAAAAYESGPRNLTGFSTLGGETNETILLKCCDYSGAISM
jgi:hypothetical protein